MCLFSRCACVVRRLINKPGRQTSSTSAYSTRPKTHGCVYTVCIQSAWFLGCLRDLTAHSRKKRAEDPDRGSRGDPRPQLTPTDTLLNLVTRRRSSSSSSCGGTWTLNLIHTYNVYMGLLCRPPIGILPSLPYKGRVKNRLLFVVVSRLLRVNMRKCETLKDRPTKRPIN